jgi:nitrogen fixation protein NifZ
MMDATQPRFAWGQNVRAVTDLFNDGSYPEQENNALLVRCGETGEVVQVGKHTDSGTVVYMVDFASRQVVGCFESELAEVSNDGGTL